MSDRRFVVVVLALLGACNLAEPERPPLRSTARVVQAVASPFLATGLDCHAHGSTACLPGPRGEPAVCFHYGPGLQDDGSDPGYACTFANCQKSADCFEGMECGTVIAGDAKLCIPRKDFVPHVALPRAAVVEQPRPQLVPPPAPPPVWLMNDAGASSRP